MAFSYYMSVKGQKQGQILSGNSKPNDSSKIAVVGFDFSVQTPRDPQSGQTSGKRQHKPITVVKEVDSSSPRLLQAYATNEALTVVIYIEGSGQAGTSAASNIALNNATIAKIHNKPGKRNLELIVFTPALAAPTHDCTRFELAFQKIAWSWSQGGKTTSDSWDSH